MTLRGNLADRVRAATEQELAEGYARPKAMVERRVPNFTSR
jgi:hypothetical protein